MKLDGHLGGMFYKRSPRLQAVNDLVNHFLY